MGDAQIAYQVIGDGPIDLVFTLGMGSNVEVWWDHPVPVHFTEGLASFSRVILFDRRGSGCSDPVLSESLPTWEEWAEDLHAVLDAVGSERAAILAEADAGPIGIMFAATYPGRTTALVLANTAARYLADEDYPFGIPVEIAERVRRSQERFFGTAEWATRAIPSMATDERFLRWFEKYIRTCSTPRAAGIQIQNAIIRDIRSVLPSIQVPTLILHRTNSHLTPVEHGRYLAEHIAGARLIEMPGADTRLYTEGADETLGHIEEFLTGGRRPAETDRVLATVLFTDIVGSTERAAVMGDREWKETLNAHDALVRGRIEAFRGRLVNTTGDGLLATFDGPGRAIRCARTIVDEVRSLGIEVRAGLHTGEIELRGDDVGGIAIHIGARVAGLAGPSEVLVSRTVTDLVAGSGIEFEDLGEQTLKGVPGEWRLYAVRR